MRRPAGPNLGVDGTWASLGEFKWLGLPFVRVSETLLRGNSSSGKLARGNWLGGTF